MALFIGRAMIAASDNDINQKMRMPFQAFNDRWQPEPKALNIFMMCELQSYNAG
jgi:hypothetical protein